MTKRCEICIHADDELHDGGDQVGFESETHEAIYEQFYYCRRFPKWESVKPDHWCAEFELDKFAASVAKALEKEK